jgi:[ribosomal protein S5]-alanine N-acetyltransferase
MALFRSVPWSDPPPMIEGAGVFLRPPAMADFEEWAYLRESSRSFLVPWEPEWPSDDLTRSAYKNRVRRYATEIRDDLSYPFFIFRSGDRSLVGGATLSNVRRGVAQSANLGYWMGQSYAGQGYMTLAVAAMIPFCHGALGLKRIEAACIPGNTPSVRLLERSGFVREGYARKYLCINGKWQDHLLYARLSSDPTGSR